MEALILLIQDGLAGIFDLVLDVITEVTASPLMLLAVCFGIVGVAISFFKRLVRG